jgi:glutathione S-transferase
MRARLALIVSRTVCEIREVKLSAKPAAMIAVSSKATVPVLVLPGGGVIDESFDIMRWALGNHDPEGWLEREDDGLIQANDGRFKHHLDRYKYPDRHQSDAVAERTAGMTMLMALEARLAVPSNLCGDGFGITDAALMPFVRQFAQTDRAWFDVQPVPALQAWLERHTASPLFGAAMIRLDPWTPEDSPITCPID